MRALLKSCVLATVCCVTAAAQCEIRLPNILSSHAVLQRDQPVTIWGWGAPEERVEVAFHNQKVSTTTDSLGHWQVTLAPESAGGPYPMVVRGSNVITLTDILVGDVYIASGQSNMGYPLTGIPPSIMPDAKQIIASANDPQLRLLRTPHNTATYPLEDQPAAWQQCSPESAAGFSALGYLFGLGIQRREHVPIGVITTAFGGSPGIAWVSMDTLSRSPQLLPEFAYWSYFADRQGEVPLTGRRLNAAKRVPGSAQKKGGVLVGMLYPNLDMWRPASLYNAMIAPFTKYAIKGVVWYQGESSTEPIRADSYLNTFSSMIADWRKHWQQGNFPFIYVQISSFTGRPTVSWGKVRDAQRRALAVANTAMVVSLDVGNPTLVHPTDKRTVADRMLLAARGLVYGENVEYSGPLFREARPEADGLRIWFDHATGLHAKSDAAQGFEVAGQDRHFFPATGVIQGETVLVSNPQVPTPRYVRYAWSNNAMDANLYNGANLPASTFTTEPEMAPPVAP